MPLPSAIPLPSDAPSPLHCLLFSLTNRLDLLAEKDQKLYETYKKKLIANIDKKGKPESEKAESKIVGAFLKSYKDLTYPDDVTEEVLKSAKVNVDDPGEEHTDGEDTGDDDDDDDNDDDDELEKPKDPTSVLSEKDLKAQQDTLNEIAVKKAEEEKKKAEAAKLASNNNSLPQEIDTNPMASVKIKDVPNFKGKSDKGFEFASTKFAMVVETKYSAVSKVLMPKRATVDFDVLHWDSPECEKILAIALYSCLYGPVGINKRATFGNLPGEYSIAELFSTAGHPGHVSNSMWRRFCERLAPLIDTTRDDVKDAKMVKIYNKVWPFCDGELITTQENKAKQEDRALITSHENKAKQKDDSMKTHGSSAEADMN